MSKQPHFSFRSPVVFYVPAVILAGVFYTSLQFPFHSNTKAQNPDVYGNGEILTTPPRTQGLGLEYPDPPSITLDGLEFLADVNGTTTRYIRPMVTTVDLTPAAGGRYWYVSPDGSEVTGDGTEDNPYQSISATVNTRAQAGILFFLNTGSIWSE
ncbi:MAG: hypothetical protein BWY68_00250 [bacterium ADurb.Bin400]|nr:MAG: hypothetical protein BWY68_00250 [bacterium ADurb.Bin400]